MNENDSSEGARAHAVSRVMLCVKILDMKDPNVAARAKQLGIHRVPAVVINGQLAECCSTR